MKKVFKIVGIALGALIILIIATGLFINFRGIPSYEPPDIAYQHTSSPQVVARGKKLASMLCAGCHLNNETGKLTGKHMTDAPPDFGMIYSANITQDSTYGIGEWTDAEIVYLLRTGIKRDGKYAPPYMAKLPKMSDEDINAIVAFLRSDERMVAADPTPDKPCEPSFLTKFLCLVAFKPFEYPSQEIKMPDTANTVELGQYLAHNLDCFSCHSADFKTNNFIEPEKSKGYFGGGNKTLDMNGNLVLTANLTPDQETGIGLWSKQKFIKALKSGIIDGEHALQYPMMPYTPLSDYEAGAIYEYLKTIPPIKNEVKRLIYD